MGDWLLYGAYGYTGALIAEAAVARGMRPHLAGRDADRLAALGERLGLPWTAASLDDPAALRKAIGDRRLVLHAAGPFTLTADPMRRACLEAGAHYLDITGEIPVFESTFALDDEARRRGIVMISGVGFDVVPSDCLALHLARAMPDAVRLELALDAVSQPSAGTLKSVIEMLPLGTWRRSSGVLGRSTATPRDRRVDFGFEHGVRAVMEAPLGDLSTAFRSTGIAEITTWLAQPPSAIRAVQRFGGLARRALAITPIRRSVQRIVDARVSGPDAALRQRGRSWVWGRVENAAGEAHEARLETCEGYRFTVEAALGLVEAALAGDARGALSPAQLVGPDFVLGLPDTRRDG